VLQTHWQRKQKIQKNASFFYKKRSTLIKSVQGHGSGIHMEATTAQPKHVGGKCPPGAPTIGRGTNPKENASFFTKQKTREAHKISKELGITWESTNSPPPPRQRQCWDECVPPCSKPLDRGKNPKESVFFF